MVKFNSVSVICLKVGKTTRTMETEQARHWRWLIFAAACVEMLMFSGILFGWGSLVYVLKADGIFSHMCTQTLYGSDVSESYKNVSFEQNSSMHFIFLAHNFSERLADSVLVQHSSVTCPNQDKMLSLVWSVVSAVLYTTSSIAGFLSYRFGTRFTRLIGWLSFTLGALFTAFTTKENPWLLFAGLPFLGFGGGILLITNIQVGMLFTKVSSTVIATISGLFDSSSITMLFVKVANENTDFSLRNSFIVLCGLQCLTLVSTFLLLPKRHYKWNADNAQFLANSEAVKAEAESVSLSETGKEACHPDEDVAVRKKDVPTLKACLLSPFYLFEVFWIALLQLRFSHFINTLNPLLMQRLHSEHKVSGYTNILSYCMMGGLLVSFVAGALFDFFKHVFSKQDVVERRHLLPAVTMLSVTSAVAVLLSVTVLVETAESLIVAFVLVALLRSFQYSVDANIISLMFPPQYYGALFGVSDLVGGVVSTLQYALVIWEQSVGAAKVHVFMMAVAAATFVHPAVQFFLALRINSKDVDLSASVQSCALVDTSFIGVVNS